MYIAIFIEYKLHQRIHG